MHWSKITFLWHQQSMQRHGCRLHIEFFTFYTVKNAIIKWLTFYYQLSSDVIKTFFKTKTKTLKFFQDKTKTKSSVQDQQQDFASQDQDQDQDQELFVMYIRGRPKSIFIFGHKRKCRRKWNSIYGRKRNEIVLGHLFSAKKWKRKSPDNISVFFFFTHSVTKSALQWAANTSSIISFFCRWALLREFHFPRVQCIDIFVAFF